MTDIRGVTGIGGVNGTTEMPDVADVTGRAGMIGNGERLGLWSAGIALGFVAFLLTWLPGNAALGWQITVGVVGLVALGVSPWQSSAMTVMAITVTLSASLALIGTSFPLITVAGAGVAALAACEAMALLRMWISVGVLDRRAESVHVSAGARRCAIAALAALAVTVAGAIKLPAPGVIAAAGVVAAATVIAVLSARSL